MAILKLSKQDILRSVNLKEGWYKGKVAKVSVAPSSKGNSTNFTYDFELEEDGRLVALNINSQVFSIYINLFQLLEGRQLPPDDYMIDTDSHIGKKVQIKIVEEPYEGRLINKCVDFLPYDKDLIPSF